jgi:hypothetical protein
MVTKHVSDVALTYVVVVVVFEPKLTVVAGTKYVFVPVIPTETVSPLYALVGEHAIDMVLFTVNAAVLLSPAVVVTYTLLEPVAAPSGTVKVIVVLLQDSGVGVKLPKCNVLAPWIAPKFTPVNVTGVVPLFPEDGLIPFDGPEPELKPTPGTP